MIGNGLSTTTKNIQEFESQSFGKYDRVNILGVPHLNFPEVTTS